MSSTGNMILILGLGNDVLGDDAVGIHAARALREEYGDIVDVAEAAVGGFALMDMLEGYERAMLIDAVVTGRAEPGTVLELAREDFGPATRTSPHYVGLPEVLALAERLSIPLPRDLRILAMEIVPPQELCESLSVEAEKGVFLLVERARAVLNDWGIVASPPHPTSEFRRQASDV